MRSLRHVVSVSLAAGLLTCGCKTQPSQPSATDSTNSPTSAPTTAAASYPIPYAPPTVESVSQVLNRVRNRLDVRMTMHVKDPETGKSIAYPENAAATQPGDSNFGLIGYPEGVIYAGMLDAAEATGDHVYSDFVAERFDYFGRTVPKFIDANIPTAKNPFHHWDKPDSLDACGAMGAALVKARRANVGPDLKFLIDRIDTFVSHGQYRLDDGTLARHRPFASCVWLDDMYMSIPLLSQMGALTGDARYYDDAAKQTVQISARLFDPATGFSTHGCDSTAPEQQPHYFWGRCNGWSIMSMCEVLDVLPENHPQRPAILALLRAQAKAIAGSQSGEGLWHEVLDRPDSYTETSCSAMFTYAIAHAVNKGWLNGYIYGPTAIVGWNGLTTRIDTDGRLSGVCKPTSYAADFAYYYARPTGDDEHGYGPVLMAGAEVIKLLKNPNYTFAREKGRPILFAAPKQAASAP